MASGSGAVVGAVEFSAEKAGIFQIPTTMAAMVANGNMAAPSLPPSLRIWDFYIGKRQSKSREEKELPEAQATVAAMIRPSDPLTPITFDFSLSNRQSGNLGIGPGPKHLESELQSVQKTSVILFLLTGQ